MSGGFRAIQILHPPPLEESAQPGAGGPHPVSPRFDAGIVVRLCHRIGGDRVIGDRLGFNRRDQIGTRRESARAGAGARKQERGQQG